MQVQALIAEDSATERSKREMISPKSFRPLKISSLIAPNRATVSTFTLTS